jgi:hypothetical protein
MRLKDIKEISSGNMRLITEFGSPGMTDSLNKIKRDCFDHTRNYRSVLRFLHG